MFGICYSHSCMVAFGEYIRTSFRAARQPQLSSCLMFLNACRQKVSVWFVVSGAGSGAAVSEALPSKQLL